MSLTKLEHYHKSLKYHWIVRWLPLISRQLKKEGSGRVSLQQLLLTLPPEFFNLALTLALRFYRHRT